jgi:hypothetical protein
MASEKSGVYSGGGGLVWCCVLTVSSKQGVGSLEKDTHALCVSER